MTQLRRNNRSKISVPDRIEHTEHPPTDYLTIVSTIPTSPPTSYPPGVGTGTGHSSVRFLSLTHRPSRKNRVYFLDFNYVHKTLHSPVQLVTFIIMLGVRVKGLSPLLRVPSHKEGRSVWHTDGRRHSDRGGETGQPGRSDVRDASTTVTVPPSLSATDREHLPCRKVGALGRHPCLNTIRDKTRETHRVTPPRVSTYHKSRSETNDVINWMGLGKTSTSLSPSLSNNQRGCQSSRS